MKNTRILSFLKSKKSIGYFAILLWCAVSALAHVYTSGIEQNTDPLVVAFFCFTMAMVFFLITSIPHFKTLWNRAFAAWRDVLGLNISTFLSWFFLLYPLKYIETSLVSTIIFGVSPILTLLLGLFLYRKKAVSVQDRWVSLLMMLVIVFIVYLIFDGDTTAQSVSVSHEALSVLFCFIVGAGVSATNIYAKRLSDEGFSSRELLGIRFWLLIIVSGIFYFHSQQVAPMDFHIILRISLMSVLLIILPMYLLFAGLRYLQPVSVSMLYPLMPAMVFFIEFFDAQFTPKWEVMVAVLGVVSLSVMGSFIRYRNENAS